MSSVDIAAAAVLLTAVAAIAGFAFGIAVGSASRDAEVQLARQSVAYWRLQAALAARDLPWPHDPETPEPPGE